uniref:J domain-containing protein n=1 Tax=Dunaliella tertiolecta TaxID=3047 RepID=A0A7S3R7C5_DUNTE
MGKHGSKDSKRKDKDKKAKKQKKDRKEKKDKKSHQETSSSSSSDEEVLSPQDQLKKEQAAVTALRDILWLHKDARKDLRELLWNVDQGKAANTAGVPDPLLKARLQQLLKLLGLRRAGAKGVFGLPQGAQPTLSVVGFVFEEQPRPPAPPKPPPISRTQASPAAPPSLPCAARNSDSTNKTSMGGPAGSAQQGKSDEGEDTRDQGEGGSVGQRAQEETEGRDSREAGCGKRVVGPAMPSAAMLAAAAEAAQHAPAQGSEEQGIEGGEDEEDDDGFLVGPLPPDLLEETDAMPEDARAAEVMRIMRVLRDAQAAHDSSSALRNPLTAPPPGSVAQADAYSVLGVAPDVSASEVKRRYMQLSLQIHPDKCLHKDAHAAFQAVSGAAKLLQDAGRRTALDAAREDRELRAMAEAEAAAQERARQWRVVKGEEPAAGSGARPSLGPIVREAWMTELPEERSFNPAEKMMSQVSQTSFSQTGIKKRGDTSMWTDTPATIAARNAQGGNALQQGAAGPLMITGGGPGGSAGGMSREDAQIMDAFNSQARKRSLLDAHQEEQAAGHKDKKKKEDKKKHGDGPPVAATKSDKPSWVGKHPWKPFDRETDLEIRGGKPKDPQKLMQVQGSLSSKFSSGGSSRTFL